MTKALLLLLGLLVASGVSGMLALRTSALNPGAVSEAAHALGLSPERIAVAVDQVAQGGQVLQRLQDERELCLALRQAGEQVEAAVAQVVSARATLESDPTNEALQAAFSARLVAASAAQASVDQIATELRAVISEGIPPAVVTRLALSGDAAARRVPASFSILDRTPKQWRKLEQALVAEARAARVGATLVPDAVLMLATTRADSGVVAAEARLSEGLASLQVALASLAGPG